LPLACAATLFLAAPAHLRAQEAPALSPLQAGNLSADEVARVELKKVLDDAIQRMREAYARGDFQAAKQVVEEIRKLDPENASARLYGNMISRKLAEGSSTVGSGGIVRTTATVARLRPSAISSSPTPAPVVGTAVVAAPTPGISPTPARTQVPSAVPRERAVHEEV
jgi:hypothetical protein